MMSDPKHYHLVGAAGVGMSALAQALLWEGYRVTGSDRYFDRGLDLTVIDRLCADGLEFVRQDGSGVGPRTTALVVSTAVEADNPDLVAAERLGVTVVHRAEMLARLLHGRHCIAVTGTSGKSTVTGMIGWMLQELGADAVVVNGASVVGWDNDVHVGNFRPGHSNLWVIEADESDRSLLHFHPEWAVVTNVSSDHFPAEEAETLFGQFCRQVRIGCLTPANAPVHLDQCNPCVLRNCTTFTYANTAFTVALPGLHNAENALHAVLLCERLGYEPDALSAALASFRGIRRRLELVGSSGGVTVIDDYGHNPAKIRAAWCALKPHYRRVVAVWRPHGYGPLAAMEDDLVETYRAVCAQEDLLFFLPVYDAGGTADRSVQSDSLCSRLAAGGLSATFVEDYDMLRTRLAATVREGDAVVVMGARDPALSGFARSLLTAFEGH